MEKLSHSDIMKQYIEYSKKRKADAKEKGKIISNQNFGLLEPSAISDLTAGIDIETVEARDRSSLFYVSKDIEEDIREKKITAPRFVYGTEMLYDNSPSGHSVYNIADDTKRVEITTTYADFTDKKAGLVRITATQLCPDGVYDIVLEGDRLKYFRFYPNKVFENASKLNRKSVEDIKRYLLGGIAHSGMPLFAWASKVWGKYGEGIDSYAMPGAETIHYQIDLKPEERYMLANKLFREGLDKIFASGKLEITAADRKYYEDMAERAKGIPEGKLKPLEEYRTKAPERAESQARALEARKKANKVKNSEWQSSSERSAEREKRQLEEYKRILEELQALQTLKRVAPEMLHEDQLDYLANDTYYTKAFEKASKGRTEEGMDPEIRELMSAYYTEQESNGRSR